LILIPFAGELNTHQPVAVFHRFSTDFDCISGFMCDKSGIQEENLNERRALFSGLICLE
jgi:hypothetical protein